MAPVSIVVADGSLLVREAFRQLGLGSTGFAVVDAVATAHQLMEAVERHRPDAVLVGTQLRGQPAVACVARIAREHAAVAPVLLTRRRDEAAAAEAARAGAVATVTLEDGPAELTAAVRAIAARRALAARR